MTQKKIANSFQFNHFSDGGICKKTLESAQTTDAKGFGEHASEKSAEFDADSRFSISPNSNPRNDLPGITRRNALSNSRNNPAINHLRRIGWGENGEKTAALRTLMRWCKFNFVGWMGMVVQFFALCVFKSAMHFNYLAATAFAVEVAVVHNFIWHERFTWADRVQPSWKTSWPRFARFNLTTGAVSIAGNLALMKTLAGFGHMNYLAANAIAIVLCALANFVVSERCVFVRE